MSREEKVKILLARMKELDSTSLERWSREKAGAECAGMWWGIAALLDLPPFDKGAGFETGK